MPSLGHLGTFGAVVCARIISSLLSLSNEGYFFGDFLKISLGLPFALFKKMLVLGDLAKNCHHLAIWALLEPLFPPKSFPFFAR